MNGMDRLRQLYRCDCGATVDLPPRELAPGFIAYDAPRCIRHPELGEMRRIPHTPPTEHDAELVEWMAQLGLDGR